ncbi:MAG: DUF4149 domain-containing protein [Halobacteria archaeon]|nr:DUF4149 domain-containing protein [Halobacteria archaeon]
MVLDSALWFVIDLSLGVWLGSIAFFSFVAAPRIFRELDRGLAGDVVNSIFPAYYLVGIGLGIIAVLSALALSQVSGFSLEVAVVIVAAIAGVVMNLYSRFVLVPKIKGADKSRPDPSPQKFRRYHRLSVILNGVTMVAIFIALVASHF